MKISSLRVCSAVTASLCVLTACGGGGGSSSSNPASANTSSSSSSVDSAIFLPVTGLYDASITTNNIKDESYLYIDPTGKVTAYNYLGDSKDAGNNCYKEATANDINVNITGKTLVYSAAKLQFSLDAGSGGDAVEVAWVLNADKQLTKITYGGIGGGEKITVTVGSKTLSVDSKRITTPTIEDITAAICK